MIYVVSLKSTLPSEAGKDNQWGKRYPRKRHLPHTANPQGRLVEPPTHICPLRESKQIKHVGSLRCSDDSAWRVKKNLGQLGLNSIQELRFRVPHLFTAPPIFCFFPPCFYHVSQAAKSIPMFSYLDCRAFLSSPPPSFQRQGPSSCPLLAPSSCRFPCIRRDNARK